jgi:hypothetical protein
MYLQVERLKDQQDSMKAALISAMDGMTQAQVSLLLILSTCPCSD